jgi:acyl-CoA synthetase (AMP-forming)/AMP-acid ligase II
MALNIADLFEHAVDAAPDKPAVKVGERTVTYAELESESNRLAHYLASQGVKAGDHVAIYAKNSIEHVVAVLATVKLRAVTINVNYRYVEGELDYLFDNSDSVAVIFERTYAPLVAACAPKHELLKTFVAIPDVIDPDDTSDVSSFGGVLYADAIAGPSTAAISGLVSRKPLSRPLITVGSYSPDSKLSEGGLASAALRSMPAQK